MNRKVPVLARHEKEAFEALGVTNGSIHADCSQACANVDFERLAATLYALLKARDPVTHLPVSFFLPASLILGLKTQGPIFAWHHKACEKTPSGPTLQDVEELVLAHWSWLSFPKS